MSESMMERARMAFIAELRQSTAWDKRVRECDVADFRLAMCAAIAALREPTEEMKTAGAFPREMGKPVARVWQAMIDQILSEHPQRSDPVEG